MKVLWVCNLILPEIAEQLGLPSLPKEGWIEGLLHGLLESKNAPEIMIAFPVPKEAGETAPGRAGVALPEGEESDAAKRIRHRGKAYVGDTEIAWFGFREDTQHPEIYRKALEQEMRDVLELAQPDIVHCYGTEYPHTLAMARAFGKPNRLLISIQGPISIYAQRYMAHLPERVRGNVSFRDLIRHDSLAQQQQDFLLRGENEKKALTLTGHVAGRTFFDQALAKRWNQMAIYHLAGETLRRTFYEGSWERSEAQPGRIFISQGDYPIKGLHYLLIAVGELLRGADASQDLQIYVAGQDIIRSDSLKDRLRRSAYANYLRELILEYDLKERVHFLGRLNAEQMKEQYLKANVYVCCSVCENSPNSLGEAMLLGTPVVAAAVGGIPSMLGSNEGWMYACDVDSTLDTIVQGLKDSLADALSQPEEADRRAACAKERARINHDPSRNRAQLEAIYGEMYS